MTPTPAQAPLPSLFLAHGAPDLTLSDHPARRFLEGLAAQLPRPRAILAVSAHWETETPSLTVGAAPKTVHDFFGWPAPLYELRYPAKTAPWLIARCSSLLDTAGYRVDHDPERGFDHGVWTPLRLVYPEADIPVVQLSLLRGCDAQRHLDLGAALAALRDEGVLVVGSGSVTHNLGAMAPEGTPPPEWALAFEEWLRDRLIADDRQALAAFDRLAPAARQAHPRAEHLMPLFVALGAGGAARRIHHSYSYGSVSMACYAFGGQAARTGSSA